MRLTLALITLALLLNSNAMAQPDPFDFAIAFDEAGTQYCGVVPGFAAPTRLYFLILNLAEQIVGYEVSISISGPGSEGWTITRGSVEGLDVDPDPDGYVVGIGVCAGAAGSNYLINTYDFGFFTAPQAPLDTLVCVGPPTVANPSIPGFVSYQTCAGVLAAAGVYPDYDPWVEIPDGCAVINNTLPYNPCSVPTEKTSWGTLKSEF